MNGSWRLPSRSTVRFAVALVLAACRSGEAPAVDVADQTTGLRDLAPGDMTLWPPDRCRPGRWMLTAGTSHDNDTGLTWQRVDAMAANGMPKGFPQVDARKYCQGLQLEGGGWYLPTFDELVTTLSQPTMANGLWIASCAFPIPSIPQFWTADASDDPLPGESGIFMQYGSQGPKGNGTQSKLDSLAKRSLSSLRLTA